ncbi:MAG TPA: DNA polymerase III subunit alpha [Rickettsiales bacterium]|nr:DNA polymerase III subunit alpha [Rickettsiales bacterium]
MTPSFVHLRVRSTYSLLEGAIRIKQLTDLAAKNNMPAVALTDHDNLFASLDFSMAASYAGIQPIIGSILSFSPLDKNESSQNNLSTPDQLLLLAKSDEGYHNLLKLCSKAYTNPDGGIAPRLNYSDLNGHTDGLIALTAGIYGAIGRKLLIGQQEAAEQALLMLRDLFPNRLYIELMRHHLDSERRIETGLIGLAQQHNIPLVATNDIHFSDAGMYEAHDALLCIADGRYVSEAERRRLTPEHRFKTPDEMCALFADIPEALENTVAIAKRCASMSPSRKPILPRFAEDEAESLRERARAGLQMRLETHVFTEGMSEEEREKVAAPYRERLEFEINVITKMQFPGYFLIVSDFITWSKEHDIPVGPGRGSGAGSLVAWALQITDLNPLRYGLLFERFLNPERVSMPDFDVDFCQDRRDEVIRYVQDKYGNDRVAQIITFGKLQARAVLRDVGRVLQLPYGQVDGICKLVPNNPAAPVTLAQAIEMEPALQSAIDADETVAHMVGIAQKLEGLNRHASTHAAGVVIGDRPLNELVPLYRDPKSDMLVVQYSMKYAEAAGLVKFDFLGLKTLTVLQKAVEMVARTGVQIDLLKLPEGDPKTYAMLGTGDAIGVFQLESTGMRDTLKRLKPDCLEDIIALVSLYRPGPMDSIPTYIARKHGHEKAEYLHPALEQVLKETFGVIIYQEQVMQIAQLLAGYSLGEADLLRRAMGKKIRAEMEAQRDIFVNRAVENGVKKEQAKSIFDLIAKFAEYGFNKSHAAAYALVSYQTAYMKANHPVEFLAASMNYDMHNTDKLAVFREEAARSGIKTLPPDINASGVLFTPEGDKAIRYGLAAIRNVGDAAMRMLIEEREKNGPFKDIWDVAARTPSHAMNRRQMEYLVKAGAFDSLHKNRNQLLQSLDVVLAYNNTIARDKESQQVSLFGGNDNAAPAAMPALALCDDWTPMERMENESEALGFFLSSHPMQGYRSSLAKLGVVPSGQFMKRLTTQYAPMKIAGLVSKIKVRSGEKGRFAFVSMSDEGGAFEISIFKEDILNRYRAQLEGGQMIVAVVDGKREENGPRLIMQSMQLLEEAIAGIQASAMPKHLLITIDTPVAAEKLRNVLGKANGSGSKITLRTLIEGSKLVDIALPGRYSLTPNSLMQIPTLEGVMATEEAAA